MKKLLFISSFALAFFWACEKVDSVAPEREEEVIEGENPDKETVDTLLTDYVLPDILYASMSGEDEDEPETRTHVDNGVVLWENGDAVSYFAGNIHNARYLYTGDDGLSKVELSKDNEKVGTTGHALLKSQAVYPYNDNITVVYEDNIDKINLTYPVTQKYGVNSFGKDANIMVAAGTHNSDDNLYFRNACGYLVIKLYGSTKVKSINLSSVNGTDKIAGPAVVVASSDAAPVVTLTEEASTAVTLDCSNGGEGVALGADKANATEFWFALPPVSFTDGIKITVNDVNGNTYTKQTSNEVNIVRNEVQPMAALKFESNAPAATKLWYTRSDDSTTPFEEFGCEEPFNTAISQHKYDAALGKIVIEFASPLTTIKAYAFEDTNIATIVLPEGVTTIEESAFENSDLREIIIPGSMNNIGINVFYDCDDLSSVTFLPSPTKTPLNIGCLDWGSEWGPFYDSPLTSIDLNRELICVWEDGSPFTPGSWDQGMFAYKDYEDVSSVSVTLGPQVETLSKYMFAYLPIQTLTIPGSVTEIHNDVFLGCTELATLTFEPSPSGTALTMGYDTDGEDENLFQDNNKLATLILDREINYTFGESAIDSDSEGLFGGMSTLTSVTLGDQVKTLHKYMFAGSGITSLNLNKVETIKEFALAGAGFNELIIPGTVTTIQNDVFRGCTNLATLTFQPSPSGTALTMGYDTDGENENLFQDNNKLATLILDREINYTFGESAIDSDSEGLFGGMSTLTSVTLGDQVKTLHKYMFAGSGITSLNLNKVETIKEFALAGAGFNELIIPGTVTTIQNDVFRGCTNLATLTFQPSSSGKPLAMGYDTNDEAENLFQDYCPLATLNLDREINYTLTGVNTDSEGLFGGMSTLTSVTLGEQVKKLSNHMFAGSSITELIIPGSVNTIENDAFHGCTNLATLTFEPSSSKTALTMGYDTDGEVENLFQDNNKLATLNLNREIIYTLGESSIDTNSEGLFGGMSTLTSVTLGDQVKTLHKYMFAGTGITSIDLNKVTTISNHALRNTGITTLTVPGNVNTIGNNVFEGCNQLASLEFKSSTSNHSLEMGYFVGSTDDDGPFYNCPLTAVILDREINYTFPDPDEADEGIFGDKSTLTDITIGDHVQTLSPYIFAKAGINNLDLKNVETVGKSAFMGTGITNLIVHPSVTLIDDHAFADCKSLEEVVLEASTQPLTIGFQPGSDQHGPFWQSPLNNVVLKREMTPTEAYAAACDQYDEGIFANEHGLKTIEGRNDLTVQIISNVNTIHPFMFSGWGMDDLTIPACVTEIKDFAFYNCQKLTDLTFSSSTKPLTLGFQDWSDEVGPFYQSPLKNIKIDRNIVYNSNYADSCDGSDEGAFSNEFYDDEVNWVTNVILGPNVTTIVPYMFSETRIQQLHIPETVENIGANVIENNEKLNAIVFYDEKERPNVEYGAFGTESNDYINNTVLPPGKGQYYIFVPYRLGRLGSYRGELYYTQDDLVHDTYWDVLHGIMVDDQPTNDYYQPHRNTESWYLNVAGYDWYKARYYDYITITPPAI